MLFKALRADFRRLEGRFDQHEAELKQRTEQVASELRALAAAVNRFLPDDMERLARQVADAVAVRTNDENRLYRAFFGAEEPLVSPPTPIPLTSSICHQVHFGLDQYRYWVKQLKERPAFHRKQWEFFFIAQALFERGMLAPGRRGLAFGAGQEPLPALFASFGATIVASDQAPDLAAASGWAQTNQYTAALSLLNQKGICTARMFSELVSFMPLDMNAIPASLNGSFDFCWSACSLEHLGSLQRGLDFVENALQTLAPRGVAVHTTEFNISSNGETFESPALSIYRRRDIERLVAELSGKGYAVSPIDWDLGVGFAELVVDLPPYDRGEPHIRLRSGAYDLTSIGLIIQKP